MKKMKEQGLFSIQKRWKTCSSLPMHLKQGCETHGLRNCSIQQTPGTWGGGGHSSEFSVSGPQWTWLSVAAPQTHAAVQKQPCATAHTQTYAACCGPRQDNRKNMLITGVKQAA